MRMEGYSVSTIWLLNVTLRRSQSWLQTLAYSSIILTYTVCIEWPILNHESYVRELGVVEVVLQGSHQFQGCTLPTVPQDLWWGISLNYEEVFIVDLTA
jgi:hypothetical protein